MGRVSLTEDYDDRSVIAKLNEMDKRVKENAVVVTSAEASAKQSAQAAQETADRFAGSVGAVVQNANAQINASKAQVDQAKAEVDVAVTTVEGYDTRLTTAEGDIDALQGVQGDYVKKAGSPQTVTSQIMVPTTDTGVRDTQIANGTRIQNDLDNYPHMVRTTGNYTIYGEVTMNKMIAGTLIPNKKQTAPYGYGANGENWHKTYTGLAASYSRGGSLIVYDVNSNEFAIFVVLAYTNLMRVHRVLGNFPLDRVKMCKKTVNSSTELAIYFKTTAQGNRLWVYIDCDFSSMNASTPYPNTSIFNPIVPTIPEVDPETSGEWETVVSGSE